MDITKPCWILRAAYTCREVVVLLLRHEDTSNSLHQSYLASIIHEIIFKYTYIEFSGFE